MGDKKDQLFTFDSEKEGQEVPTLTSLLYKKNLVKTTPSERQKVSKGGDRPVTATEPNQSRKMTLEPTVTIERPIPTNEPATSISIPKSTAGSPGIIRSSIASPSGEVKALGAATGVLGYAKAIPASAPYTPTPIIKPVGAEGYPATAFAAPGLRSMIQKPRINAALVFEAATPDTFRMSSILQSPAASSRTQLWNGMEFSTREFSDLWGRLGKFGFAEFSTLGAAGNGNSDRLAFRTAFQAKGGEWVTFVRVKESSGKEGLVVFLSEVSIQAFLPVFHSEVLGAEAGLIPLAA